MGTLILDNNLLLRLAHEHALVADFPFLRELAEAQRQDGAAGGGCGCSRPRPASRVQASLERAKSHLRSLPRESVAKLKSRLGPAVTDLVVYATDEKGRIIPYHL